MVRYTPTPTSPSLHPLLGSSHLPRLWRMRGSGGPPVIPAEPFRLCSRRLFKEVPLTQSEVYRRHLVTPLLSLQGAHWGGAGVKFSLIN